MLARFYTWKAEKPNWINRYTIVCFVFAIWMLFFDRHDIFTHIFLSNRLNELESEKELYEEGIEKTHKMYDQINNDIEKYAREQYYMHRADEEVFIIRTSD